MSEPNSPEPSPEPNSVVSPEPSPEPDVKHNKNEQLKAARQSKARKRKLNEDLLSDLSSKVDFLFTDKKNKRVKTEPVVTTSPSDHDEEADPVRVTRDRNIDEKKRQNPLNRPVPYFETKL